MTQGEILVTIIPLAIVAGMYAYILNERRKVIAAREARQRRQPAE